VHVEPLAVGRSTRRSGPTAALSAVALTAAALGAIAGGRPAAAAPPDPSIGAVTFATRFVASASPTSTAQAIAVYKSAPATTSGYCAAAIVPLPGSSNHAVCAGSRTSIGFHASVPFMADTAGLWSFRVGADLGYGGTLLVDGQALASHWYDMWWAGNWSNTGQILQGSATLAPGSHLLEVYGFETCCDGAWGAQLQPPGGSWQDVDTSPPAVAVTGVAATTYEFGSVPAAGCAVSDAFDGSRTFSATLSALSGPRAAAGLGEQTASCAYTDSRGLSATASATYDIVDTTPPLITLAAAAITAEATGPAGATVDYQAPSATDAVDGALPVSCAPASGSQFAIGTATVTCSATDLSCNTGTATFTVTVRDTTPPAITVPQDISVTATSAHGAVVTYSASATDVVDGAVPVTCDHISGSTFAPGVTTVTCTATDSHGNTGSAAFTVTVSFAWSGLQPPVAGGHTYHLGSTIPVRFTLPGMSGAAAYVPARLYLTDESTTPAGAEQLATSTSPVDSGNLFRYDAASGQYTYNLATKPLAPGTWLLRIDLGDGAPHTVSIVLG